MERAKNIEIENARIVFRNFSGEEGKFNVKGDRNFCVLIDDDHAELLKNDGWNIKWLRPRDEDDSEQAYLPVKVNYNNIPPKVVLVTSHGKTQLDEDTIGSLDWAELENVDLIIRPYDWNVNGKTGRKAYLKAGYFTIVEDVFESKYYDVPDSAVNSISDDVPF